MHTSPDCTSVCALHVTQLKYRNISLLRSSCEGGFVPYSGYVWGQVGLGAWVSTISAKYSWRYTGWNLLNRDTTQHQLATLGNFKCPIKANLANEGQYSLVLFLCQDETNELFPPDDRYFQTYNSGQNFLLISLGE